MRAGEVGEGLWLECRVDHVHPTRACNARLCWFLHDTASIIVVCVFLAFSCTTQSASTHFPIIVVIPSLRAHGQVSHLSQSKRHRISNQGK
jgi:hypothetical protein